MEPLLWVPWMQNHHRPYQEEWNNNVKYKKYKIVHSFPSEVRSNVINHQSHLSVSTYFVSDQVAETNKMISS